MPIPQTQLSTIFRLPCIFHDATPSLSSPRIIQALGLSTIRRTCAFALSQEPWRLKLQAGKRSDMRTGRRTGRRTAPWYEDWRSNDGTTEGQVCSESCRHLPATAWKQAKAHPYRYPEDYPRRRYAFQGSLRYLPTDRHCIALCASYTFLLRGLSFANVTLQPLNSHADRHSCCNLVTIAIPSYL